MKMKFKNICAFDLRGASFLSYFTVAVLQSFDEILSVSTRFKYIFK